MGNFESYLKYVECKHIPFCHKSSDFILCPDVAMNVQLPMSFYSDSLISVFSYATRFRLFYDLFCVI